MSSLLYTVITAVPEGLGVMGLIVLIILTITTLDLLRRLFSDASLPRNLPWAGTGGRKDPLSIAKANLRSFFRLKNLLAEGYTKYSKNDQTYVLPYFINGPQVILPPSQIPWLMEQPEDVLNQERVNRQFLQADYAFFHANLVEGPVHPEIIQHQLTKKLDSFADDIVDEARASLEDSWGVDTEAWREVSVYDTVLHIISRLSVRVLMGPPLCRDGAFLFICSNFIRKVALAAAAISLFPWFLQPIVAPIFTLYDRFLYLRCRSHLMPIIHERLEQVQKKKKDTTESKTPSNDYVEWAISHALAKPIPNPTELDPRVIAGRLAVLAFAMIQSSVITLTNALFDIAASPGCVETLAAMREDVLRETGGKGQTRWGKMALSRMTRVDSALRESLRLNGFIERGIMKMVVAPEGVTLPDGSHIPYGVKVGVSGYSIHHDEDNYRDATRFDALRFIQEGGTGKRAQGFVNTSEKFMGFSHGSHACPGRFFATHQLKIALGHIALLYDIEPTAQRPENEWFFGHIAPPLTATLRVRRRKAQELSRGERL
ncbi:cytochrome P450 [Xylaria sp. CBS 124048]|nr:cytochrome P450 [Xylaria sp. CBS 124048]